MKSVISKASLPPWPMSFPKVKQTGFQTCLNMNHWRHSSCALCVTAAAASIGSFHPIEAPVIFSTPFSHTHTRAGQSECSTGRMKPPSPSTIFFRMYTSLEKSLDWVWAECTTPGEHTHSHTLLFPHNDRAAIIPPPTTQSQTVTWREPALLAAPPLRSEWEIMNQTLFAELPSKAFFFFPHYIIVSLSLSAPYRNL